MSFHFSIYSSPLLFGFVQGWLYAILLWNRARREERLSDSLLGWVLVACCFEIWEYLLGFGGLDFLWRELDFFPRTLGFLLPALCFFYLKSQFNADFRFRPADLLHAAPFLLFSGYHLLVFAQGAAFVRDWQQQVHYPMGIPHLEFLVGVGLTVTYFVKSLRLYREYRTWTTTQFSDPEAISFHWFRNFLIAFFLKDLVGLAVTISDFFLNLDYQQDWWDELFGAGLIYYLSINGYGQPQPTRRLHFIAEPLHLEPVEEVRPTEFPPELRALREALPRWMESQKPYLDAELTLADLAWQLQIAPPVLSQVINAGFGKNFNDFVNEYRVEEFKRAVQRPANAHLSLLGVALDCGFNSKATFNRAFKKRTGISPKEFAAEHPPNNPKKAPKPKNAPA